MAIHAIEGIPGQGKSCFAVGHVLFNELETGDRPIYTNLAIYPDEITQYFERIGIEVDVGRITVLTNDQIKTFWLHVSQDCLVVIDEAAKHFNANSWKSFAEQTGTLEDAGEYFRTHRHYGHEVYMLGQVLTHIYKQLRDLIECTIKVTNLTTRKFMGIRGPKMFLAKFYYPGDSKSADQRSYAFDKEIFACYNTHSERGVLDRPAAKRSASKVKKRNFKYYWRAIKKGAGGKIWWLVLIGMVAFLLLMMNGISWVSKKAINSNGAKHEEDTMHIESAPGDTFDQGRQFTEQFNPGAGRKGKQRLYDFGRYDTPTKRVP